MAESDAQPEPALTEVLDPDLYPDLIRQGGLAAAMSDVARRNNIDLGTVGVHSRSGRFNSAMIDSGRGTISVLLGAERRFFDVNIYGKTHPWARGATDDLTATVMVADAWRRGATLTELTGEFPFMSCTELAQAYESGDPVTTQWQRLLEDGDLESIRPLLRAAYANSRIRSLFPVVSHTTLLRLARNPVDRSGDETWITQTSDDAYRVELTRRDRPQRVAGSPGEAIEVALSYLD
ncbi:DUF6193 family natural product biosynthesis protein [Planosporangium mesophilum]|uniref:Uncharacterized protein n=1 Tax=Planosporangium mesophilum TaxID=689768 RepID=A0A8J3TCM7_9ACTN|nr:DUF6193 family natural product biosynthesis protein [Planosporangium mesophilum]NJC85136.1 hypothetical protein [Planosporangium mesophilum]GII24278.1 hypothetical protein Pme01_38750 [Planosporangium mesophilum]